MRLADCMLHIVGQVKVISSLRNAQHVFVSSLFSCGTLCVSFHARSGCEFVGHRIQASDLPYARADSVPPHDM